MYKPGDRIEEINGHRSGTVLSCKILYYRIIWDGKKSPTEHPAAWINLNFSYQIRNHLRLVK